MFVIILVSDLRVPRDTRPTSRVCREIPGPGHAVRDFAPFGRVSTFVLFIALVAPQPISVNLTVIIARFARIRALWKSALSTEDSDTSR
jgi:hypothetical protein